MTTAVQTSKRSALQMQIDNPVIKARFQEVLKDRAPQFISSLLQVGNSLGPDCEPLSIISGAMQAASLDLPINKNFGFAWLVPFKDKGVKKAQFQLGYRGLLQLAQRSGQYERMNAGPINSECVGGYDSVGERILDFTHLDPDKPASGYFFAFKLKNGFTKICYWSRKDVEAHARQYSQSYRGGYDSPWKTHFDQMATKTVIANELRQWGILSVEMQKAMETDGAIVEGMDSPIITFPDSETDTPLVEVGTAPEPQPPQNDDGDLGPQTAPAPEALTKPQVANPTPPPAQAAAKAAQTFPRGSAATPQSELAKAILTAKLASGEPAGLSYDDFQGWATQIGLLDCSAFASFEEIPAADAKRIILVNSKNGSVIKGILEAKGMQ